MKSHYREPLPRYRAGMGGYRDLFNASIADPAAFWADAARAVTWIREPQRVLDDSNPPFYRWFPDGELNTCANALDRHVDGGRAEQPALIYDSPVTGSQRTYTYRELLDETARFAGALRGLGVGKGDRVVIYMPMVPEAVIAMLACARLGAVHSVVFGGFAAHELAARIDDAQPAVIVSASCGVEPTRIVDYKPMLDTALEIAEHAPPACVILQRDQRPCRADPGPRPRLARADGRCATRRRGSGRGDRPAVRAVHLRHHRQAEGHRPRQRRACGGAAVEHAPHLRHRPGEVYWAASDVGWVVGHSYIVYGPLLLGATTVLYEGKPVGTPDAGAFWRVASEHGVNALFTRADGDPRDQEGRPRGSAPRQVRPVGAEVSVPGRRTPRPRHLRLGVGQTRHPRRGPLVADRNGLAISANPMGVEPLPIKPGSSTVPMPGYDVRILRPDGSECDAGEEGAICVRLPLPPGTLPTLWGDDDRYVSSYLSAFPGYYLTGDGGYFDEDGYLFVMGRTDDVINVAGHRMSTGSIEAVLAGHPAVAECAVIGVADEIRGQVPRGFVVLKAGATADGSPKS